ncbi:sensor domain-containing diguanylate cyclase [Methylobacterium sp. JK268]
MQLRRQNLNRPERPTRPPWILVVFSFAVTVALCALAGSLILTLRANAWSEAARNSETVLQSLAHALDRDIELYDLSLQGVVEGLQNPALEGVSPEVRRLALFDRAASARGFGSILVLDAQGVAYIDASAIVPRQLNAADRDYFLAHRADPRDGLHIGRPLTSAVSGKAMIPLSRRVTYADGAFAGVVVGTIELAHFAELFERLGGALGSAVTFLRDDGVLLIRTPVGRWSPGWEAAENPNVRRILREGEGRFVAVSPSDGVTRSHVFTRVGQWPLRLAVSLSVQDIDAVWRPKAALIGLLALVMCAGIGVLTVWLAGELQRRTAAEEAARATSQELARLASTDSLTGLANRRAFDDALAQARQDAEREPLALLLFDTDRFKPYNDIYGHPAGDRVLQAIGRILRRHADRPGDLACRIGGEEFALVARGIGEDAAVALAEKIRAAVAGARIPHVGQPSGFVTVSAGVMHADRFRGGTAEEWFSAADGALYAAKRMGRDQVRVAA